MNKLFFVAFLLVTISCKTTSQNSTTSQTTVQVSAADYLKYIQAEDAKKQLYIFASNEMEGRKTGEGGQKKAAEFLKDFYIKYNIASPISTANYFQTIPESFFKSGSGIKSSENVIAYIKGSEKPEEVVIISAHYDHVGMDKKGNVFNGADDDGSGTIGILQIAKAFKKAQEEGNGPKRSIVFLHVTGEEIGLFGSKYYTDNPIFPLKNTVANLNIDMIGRIDPLKIGNPNYIYLIGSDKLSHDLHLVSEEMNKAYINLELDYTFNDDKDPNRFYYRSDHYNFAKNNIPVIFYFNGVHEDYHKITDTPDKIEYDLLAKRAKLVFVTAWELANRKERIALDIIK
ncbi:MAG: peptidase M28 [Bacteroidetes bacterium HGW-Bacteroidetes-2]|jgi:Zn-dependent M28 family amino/carboxypeptidase|nr:MAG: peptidase M28 [Bacteroidetes bacterium HGW-Bacteroidetes-2]